MSNGNEVAKRSSVSATTFKLLLIGDSGTGKSSLLLRFTDDTFLEDEMSSTIGVDFKVKYWNVPSEPSSMIKLTLWDTAGQERFRTLTSSYYRGAHGVILVYDVTRRESFDNLANIWIPELDSFTQGNKVQPVKIVVGNKIDKSADRVVSREEGAKFAKDNQALFIESSAKTMVGVSQAFEELCLKIHETPDLWSETPSKNSAGLNLSSGSGMDQDLCAC